MGEPSSLIEQPAVDVDIAVDMYRRMLDSRQLGASLHQLFLEGLVKGSIHLSTGQEAIAAGFGAAMRPDDYTFCTYRGHAHTLARGVAMLPILLELTGRAGGLNGGKGGSMHLTSVDHGHMGSYAIVGAHMPLALGAAWSSQIRKSGQVSVCFFGDGATNIGAFHEAMNLAAVWKVPAVFVCENNLYMEYTPIGAVTAVPNPAAGRAAAYGLEPVLIDGNDADIVYTSARYFIDRARAGGGPALIEAVTYRHGGHSRGDQGKYRPEAELKHWLARDPLPAYRTRLLARGVAAHDLEALEQRAKEEVAAAERIARAAPEPGPDTLLTDVWSDGSAAWRN